MKYFPDDIRRNVQYAVRVLRRNPVFTITAVLSLGLGIGANLGVFSLLNALLLESLPVHRPRDLVLLEEKGITVFAYPVYDQLRRGSRLISVVGMSRNFERPSEIQESGERSPAFLQMVSEDYFSVLGVQPLRGRLFTGSDEAVAVISESYWRRHYTAGAAALGAHIHYANREFTIVGITPAGFRGMEVDLPNDIWVPMEQAIPASSDARTHGRMFRIVGRLHPGATAIQAQAEVEAILQKPFRLQPGATGYSALRSRLAVPLLLLELLVGLVLLVTCANLANLVMTGAASRERELATRQALGASRGRLVWQLFTETLVISAAGGALALLVAYWTSAALLSFLPAEQAAALVNLRFNPDLRLLGFAALLTFITSLLFGFIPAMRATRAHAPSLARTGPGGGQRTRSWMSRGLIIGEVSMCTLLLMVAAVFVRSLQNLRWQDTGYREAGLLVADIEPPREYREAQRDRFYAELRARAAALPGVESAAFSHLGQLSGGSIEYRVRVAGQSNAAGESGGQVSEQRITPGFLTAMGTQFTAGRDFTERDDEAATPVAIVNQAFARRFFAGAEPIGRRFTVERLDGSRAWDAIEIVGVVKNSKWIDLRSESPVMYYRPYLQAAGRPTVRFAIRSQGDLRVLAGLFVQTAQSIDRQIAVKNVVPFSEIVDRTLLAERLVTNVSAALSVLALMIAPIGLYGLLAYDIARRRREIGVRIAVGASPGSVEWLFLRESLVLLAAGFAIGLPAAVVVTRLVSAMLFGLIPGDPTSMAATLLVLSLATASAAYFPARRAAMTDPIVVLREE